jgi:catechol 2,3-dioxygenase-like lactoylglutathione lyase family enzyme
MIAGIDHFVLTVSDLDRTLEFYKRVLGGNRGGRSDQAAANNPARGSRARPPSNDGNRPARRCVDQGSMTRASWS